MRKKYFSLILSLALVFLIEVLGRVLTMESVSSWYLTLQKPSWTPPSWVFAPVWTLLYISMGVSSWLIFLKVQSVAKHKTPFLVYGLQLALNLLWSYCFFVLESPLLALIDVLALLVIISINIIVFAKIYKPAGLLLIPYFIWTCYAAVLNFAIWQLLK